MLVHMTPRNYQNFQVTSCINYCIVGNFRGRKLSRISRFESHPWKFFPWNFRVCSTHLCLVSSNPWKFSPWNSHFLRIRESLLPRKFTAIWYSNYLITTERRGEAENWSELILIMLVCFAHISKQYCVPYACIHVHCVIHFLKARYMYMYV